MNWQLIVLADNDNNVKQKHEEWRHASLITTEESTQFSSGSCHRPILCLCGGPRDGMLFFGPRRITKPEIDLLSQI